MPITENKPFNSETQKEYKQNIANKIKDDFLARRERKEEAKKSETIKGLDQHFYTANDLFSLAEILPDRADQKIEQKFEPAKERQINIVIAESDIFSAIHKLQGDILICDVDRTLLKFLEAQNVLMRSLYHKYKNGELAFAAITEEYELWLLTQDIAEFFVTNRKQTLGKLHFLYNEENFVKAMQAFEKVNIIMLDINLFEKQEQNALLESLSNNGVQVKVCNLTNLPDYDTNNSIQYLIDKMPWTKDPLIVCNIHDRGPLNPSFGVIPDRHALFIASSPEEYKRNFDKRPEFFAELDVETFRSGDQQFQLENICYNDLRRYTKHNNLRQEMFDETCRQRYLARFSQLASKTITLSFQTICEHYSAKARVDDEQQPMAILGLKKIQPELLLKKAIEWREFYHHSLPEKIREKVVPILKIALEGCLELGLLDAAQQVIDEINHNCKTEMAAKIIAETKGYSLLLSYLEDFIKANYYSETVDDTLEKATDLLHELNFTKEHFIKRMSNLSSKGFQLASMMLIKIYQHEFKYEASLPQPIIQKMIACLKQIAKGTDRAAAIFAKNILKEKGLADASSVADIDSKNDSSDAVKTKDESKSVTSEKTESTASLTDALYNNDFDLARHLVASGVNLRESKDNNLSALAILESSIFEKLTFWQLDKELVEPTLLEKETLLKTKAAEAGLHTEEDYQAAQFETHPLDVHRMIAKEVPDKILDCIILKAHLAIKRKKLISDRNYLDSLIALRYELIKLSEEFNSKVSRVHGATLMAERGFGPGLLNIGSAERADTSQVLDTHQEAKVFISNSLA